MLDSNVVKKSQSPEDGGSVPLHLLPPLCLHALDSAQSSSHHTLQNDPSPTITSHSSLLLPFSGGEQLVVDGLRGNNGEKETDLKRIDFLILISTFPPLRSKVRSW